MACCCSRRVAGVCLAQGQEQADLEKALSEAGSSPLEYLRAIEKHLEQYPNSARRPELERAAVRAAIEARDDQPHHPVRRARAGAPAGRPANPGAGHPRAACRRLEGGFGARPEVCAPVRRAGPADAEGQRARRDAWAAPMAQRNRSAAWDARSATRRAPAATWGAWRKRWRWPSAHLRLTRMPIPRARRRAGTSAWANRKKPPAAWPMPSPSPTRARPMPAGRATAGAWASSIARPKARKTASATWCSRPTTATSR